MVKKAARKTKKDRLAPSILQFPRGRKCKQWQEETMTAALEVFNKGKSVKRVPMEHRVPRTTLHDRHSGRVVHGSNTALLTQSRRGGTS